MTTYVKSKVRSVLNIYEETRKEVGQLIPMWLVLVVNFCHLLSELYDLIHYWNGEIIWRRLLTDFDAGNQVVGGLVGSVLVVMYLKRKKSTSIKAMFLVAALTIFFLIYCGFE